MAAEFVDYKKAPGFWFHIGMIIASDVSTNPKLSVRYSKMELAGYDIFEIFDAGMERYIKATARRGNYTW